MSWEETHRRLVEGLRGEVRGRWGRIGEVEAHLGVSDGYLNKLCSGRNEFRLGLFLEVIEALGLDPTTFFARALEIVPRPEDYLAQLRTPGGRDCAGAKLARATLELEAAEPPAAGPPSALRAAEKAAELADQLVANPCQVQLRGLRRGARYRSQAFARAYLERLDSLRYDDAVTAAKLAAATAVHLVPALPGPREPRLSLLCLALGVFGAARRLKGEFDSAAQAYLLALGVSRRANLREDTANLLIRASYLLKDFGHFQRALSLLDEALVIFVQLGSRQGMGKALVDHGMMRTALGDYETAILDLEQALEYLDGSARSMPRSHLAAYQFLAFAHEQMGDLGEAERWLSEGTRRFATSHAVDQAKLQWLHGTLAFRRGAFERSEKLLRTAREILASHENTLQEAVITLDLIAAILAQGKIPEAVRIAQSMSGLLLRFKNNLFAEAAIVELINAALAGELSQEAVLAARAKLERDRSPRRGPSPGAQP